MSVLEEAPQERMPIQTYVMEYNDEMVREAITRELCERRTGLLCLQSSQRHCRGCRTVFKDLFRSECSICPRTDEGDELEKIMYDFINGDIDVLVRQRLLRRDWISPNANTMIIHDADRLGFLSFYQLRGRVGRSKRMAYAFLCTGRDKLLKEIAEKRLAAIREFTDLGSGIKIAMRDLEIRGAGNLLGAEQHGHMEAVGYDLYCKMLNEAVKHLKGESEAGNVYDSIDLNVDAYIPESYIPNEYHKLDIYKRIAAIESEEEMDDMIRGVDRPLWRYSEKSASSL